MDFRLLYQGPLQGQNARAEHKHQIRLALHPQLRRLWATPPLNAMTDLLAHPAQPSEVSVVVEKAGRRFAPLVTTRLDLYAELHILLFRPQPRGYLITDGGDIDNRLKTLLDALRIPRAPGELPASATVSEIGDDGLFYCLLEDDSLVTKVGVETEQLLQPYDSDSILAVIHVVIKKTRTSYANIAF
jgi:hypothetical protein